VYVLSVTMGQNQSVDRFNAPYAAVCQCPKGEVSIMQLAVSRALSPAIKCLSVQEKGTAKEDHPCGSAIKGLRVLIKAMAEVDIVNACQ